MDSNRDYEVIDGTDFTSMVAISAEREACPSMGTSLAAKKIDQKQSADYEEATVTVVRDTESLAHEYEEVAPLQQRENRIRGNQQTGRVISNGADDMTEMQRSEEERGGDTSGQSAENECIVPLTANRAYVMMNC